MKRIAIIFIALFVGVATFPQNLKFGHVNTEKVFESMPEKNTVVKELEQYRRQLEQQLMSMNRELEEKYNDYIENAENLSRSIRQVREEELQNLQRRIQVFQMSANEDIQEKEQELLEPLFNKINNAISKIGEEGGYIYIFDEAAFHYNSPQSVDLTQEIIEYLNN